MQAALDEGIDLVIAGAGFSRDVFAWGKEFEVPIVPIVGSARVAKLAEKFGAAAVVVEGVEAGGHLGTDRLMRDLLPEIVEAVDIPVIGAGGVVTGADIKEILDLGAAGVQMGTRFAATVESSAPDAFKQMYVDATPDEVVLVKSPVGLPGRALKNPFWERTQHEDYPRDPEVQIMPQGVPQGVLHHRRARDGARRRRRARSGLRRFSRGPHPRHTVGRRPHEATRVGVRCKPKGSTA